MNYEKVEDLILPFRQARISIETARTMFSITSKLTQEEKDYFCILLSLGCHNNSIVWKEISTRRENETV